MNPDDELSNGPVLATLALGVALKHYRRCSSVMRMACPACVYEAVTKDPKRAAPREGGPTTSLVDADGGSVAAW